MVQIVNTTVWNHPATSYGQLCLYGGLIFPLCHQNIVSHRAQVSLFLSIILVATVTENVCAVTVAADADTHNAPRCSSEVVSQTVCWNKAISRLSSKACLWDFVWQLDSLLKSHWGDVTTRRRPDKPSTGSYRDLSDTSLGWGEMILIVALSQPSA